jgi:hypothetical protein
MCAIALKKEKGIIVSVEEEERAASPVIFSDGGGGKCNGGQSSGMVQRGSGTFEELDMMQEERWDGKKDPSKAK